MSSLDTLSEAIKEFQHGRTSILTVIRLAHRVATHVAIWSVDDTDIALNAANELAADWKNGIAIFTAKES